jgi:hypothetical protein
MAAAVAAVGGIKPHGAARAQALVVPGRTDQLAQRRLENLGGLLAQTKRAIQT